MKDLLERWQLTLAEEYQDGDGAVRLPAADDGRHARARLEVVAWLS